MNGIAQNTAKQAGISLLEVLLSISITAMIVMGAVQMSEEWAKRVRHKEEAGYLFTVNNAAKSYVSSNFAAIMQDGFDESLGDVNNDNVIDNGDLSNIGKAIMIPMDDGAGDFHLKDGISGLPVTFPSTTPLGRDVQIYVRNLGFIGSQRMLEVFTVTTLAALNGRRPLSRLDAREIAQAIGPEGGLYEHDLTCRRSTLQSVYGSWSLGNNDLANPGSMMPGTPSYCPAVNVAEGFDAYVALQNRVAFDGGTVGDFLFRVSIPGAPELNRMNTNIDMAGNPILNVSSLSVDNIQVNGNATINSSETGTALFVDQKFQVAGNGSFVRGRQETSPTGTPRVVSGGNVQVKGVRGSMKATSLNAANSSLNAKDMKVDGGLAIGRNLGVRDNLTASVRMTTGQIASASTIFDAGTKIDINQLQVASNTSAAKLEAGTLSAAVLQTSGTMTIDNNLDVVGSLSFNSANLAGGIVADQLQVSRLTACKATVKYDWAKREYVRTASYDCKKGPD